MKDAPVTLDRTGDDVSITAYISFKGNYAVKILETGSTYAEAAALSIEQRWSGDFNVCGRQLHVKTRVYSNSPSPNKILKPAGDWRDNEQTPGLPPLGRKFLTMKISGFTPASKIMRSHERLSWLGVLKNNESITSWSLEESSSPIVIYVTENFQGDRPFSLIGRNSFERLAAHEFGHALGLGDAYNAGYRGGRFPWTLDGFYAPARYQAVDRSGKVYTVSVPNDDIMIYNGKVSDNDMRMVLEAYATGVQQFFPFGSKEWDKR